MHEVIGDVDFSHGVGQGVGVANVARHDLDPAAPLGVTQAFGPAGKTPQLVSAGEQFGRQPATQISGRAGHQDSHPSD